MQDAGLGPEPSVIIPLGLLPKAIYQSFDVRGPSGESLPLHSRWTDSAVAASLLEKALEWDGVAAPASPRIKAQLFDLCHSMASGPLAQRMAALPDLTDEERTWLSESENSELFGWLCDALGSNFLALTEITLGITDPIIKIRRIEETAENPIRNTYLATFSGPVDLLVFDAPDFGWPTSDHLRVDAPDGTFLTDSLLWGGSEAVKYQSDISRGRSSFYAHALDGDAGTNPVMYVSSLWPAPRGAMRPMMLLTAYVAVVLLLGAALEFLTQWRSCAALPLPKGFPVQGNPGPCMDRGFLWGLLGSADAVFSVVFVAPSLLIAYVLRDKDSEIRRDLLESWQHSSLGSLVPAWIASLVVLSSRGLTAQWLIWVIWLACGIFALYLAVRVFLYWRDVSRAHQVAQSSSGTVQWNTANFGGLDQTELKVENPVGSMASRTGVAATQ